MFSIGNLLRVNDYKFDDGGDDRDKYLIVLNTEEDELSVIHCLTTKNNKYNAISPPFGCNQYRNNRYWVFPKNQKIGHLNYSFELDTFVFFYNNVRKDSIRKFEKQISRGIFGIVHLDTLPYEIFRNLLSCIIASQMAPEEIEDGLIFLKGNL